MLAERTPMLALFWQTGVTLPLPNSFLTSSFALFTLILVVAVAILSVPVVVVVSMRVIVSMEVELPYVKLLRSLFDTEEL